MTYFSKSSLLLAMCLAGCTTGDQYRQQVAPLEAPLHYGQRDFAGSGSRQVVATGATFPAQAVTEDPWWESFWDLRLNRLVDQALRVNSDLASAGFALRKARLSVGLASNDLLPQPSADLSGNASRRLDSSDNTTHQYGSTNSLSWEIDLWGRLRAARDAKRWAAEASAQDLQYTALSLVADVCRDYWTLAYLNQSISAGEENLTELSRIVELVSVQRQAGQVSLLELREAQQNLESELAAQSALVQQREETRNAIAALLDGQSLPLNDEPQTLSDAQMLTVEEGLPAELLGRRPDLRAAELRLRESLIEVDVTARSYYPRLSLTGSMESGGTSLGSVLSNPVATLGAGLSLPFLNLGQMKFNTEIAGTTYLQSASQFRTTLYEALKEVQDSLSARDQYALQIGAKARSFDAAVDVERMYEVRYRTGASTLRTWLDARRTLRNSELALAQARRDLLINDVSLMLALGGSLSVNLGVTSRSSLSEDAEKIAHLPSVSHQ
ncbi:efflux transporter outer membrane subunit [Pseudomonas fulva]|uniref:efflux transporter outer membrane subunit n=1 Tax=Pseudomonas fulva TaxID=47880 RepID=UPI00201D31FC|nr:efflux transporter outer membrane subunit [Pseudomonas fulva]UQY33034.1 efflux transporter outer membrane subunit [Pseudomonas fulva]